jgi:PKD repeat protein
MLMKKKYLLLIFICSNFISAGVFAQPGEWTWVNGDNTANAPGNFGTQGVSSPSNKPPALYEGCEWTDHNGNFWLYGGQHTAGNFYADLWKYDPSINEWVWVNGPGLINQPAVYGTQGVPSPANNPGGRGWAPSSWVDANNNLWMFAGCDQGSADMNNLWMYNITTNEWTWMHGASFSGSSGSPGVMGVPAITNEPSARHECTCSWIDVTGDLWFFGGFGFSQTDDLWRYNIASNMWTWVKGDPVNTNMVVYGTQGIPDPANTPGARNSYSRWADKSGNLWLFGGILYSAGAFNDVWKYNIASSEWTWMKGPNVTGDPGNYGVQCIEDSLNNPPSHVENRSCWTDSCGQMWMFGGVIDVVSYDGKNDLWKYSPVTNDWTWASGGSGINAAGNYGSIGISSPANVPPARMGSFAWQDINGNLWSGFGYSNGNYLNDLWRYVPDPACGACSLIPVALFSAPNHICPGTCTDFINLSQAASTYQWSFPGATPSSSVDANPVNICYNTPGSYAVTLIAANSLTSDTLLLNNYITVYPYPAPQGISQNGDTLFANTGAVSYQWYQNGIAIPGATDYFYVAPQSGNYNLVATDLNGCEVEAVIFDVVADINESSGSGKMQFTVFPNPVIDKLLIQSRVLSGSAEYSIYKISICDMLGKAVALPVDYGRGSNQQSIELNVSGLAQGMYYLEIFSSSSSGGHYRMKFIKQ